MDKSPPELVERFNDLATLAAGARGEVRSEALVEACLGRIAAHDDAVIAVVRLDRDGAL